MTEFEDNENLGLIFPEIFYKVYANYTKNNIDLHLHQINLLLNKIFPNVKIIKNFDFSEVNMFWGKINAIHQIFKNNFIRKIKNKNKKFKMK